MRFFFTWRPARRRHDARVLHLGEPEVADHDLRVRVLVLVQQVLRLQVAVNHALAVHVRDGVQDLEIRTTEGLTHTKRKQKQTLFNDLRQGIAITNPTGMLIYKVVHLPL